MANVTSLSRSLGRAMLLLGLCLFITLQGATNPTAFALSSVSLAAAALLGAGHLPIYPLARRSFRGILLLAMVLATYVLFQSLTFHGNPFAHTVWATLDFDGMSEGGAISVHPAQTRQGLMTLLAPMFFYASTLCLFSDDASAHRLVKILAIIGGGFAIFGILQLLFLPGWLLYEAKTTHIHDLTGFFVNRNTAATLLGVASLAALAWLQMSTRRTALDGKRGISAYPGWSVLIPAVIWMVTIVSLFMTRSRGGVLSVLLAYLVVFPLLLSQWRDVLGGGAVGRFLVRRTGLMLTAVGVVVVIGMLLGARTSLRMAQEGVDMVRLCLYSASLRAYLDNWLFGTGLGTFSSVFPGYRTIDCGPSEWVFFRVHNFFIEGLLGLGLIFLPVLGYAYAHLCKILWTGYRERRLARAIPVAGIGAAILTTLHGMTDFSMQIPGFAAYLACFLAAVTTISGARSTAIRNRPSDARKREKSPAPPMGRKINENS